MSIVANFDINLRGNTASVDQAADQTAGKISKLREAVDHHASGISARFGELGGKVRAAFSAFPGAGVVTAVLGPAVFLGGALGRAFSSSVAGILSATSAVGAFGVAATVATGGLNLVLAAVAATGAAALGAGMAWTSLGLASVGGIKEAQKAAEKLGMSVEAVQGFAFKGRLELEELSGLLLKMERNIGEGKSSAFTKLNLDAAKLKAARPEDSLRLIADAFDGIGNQADRVSLSMEIFGKQGAAALKLLKGGSKGITESLQEARNLGIITSAAETKQVAEAAGALKLLKMSLTGLGKTAAITIAPFVKMIAEYLTNVMKWINSVRDSIITFAYKVEFTLRHFSDYVHLYFSKAILWVTQFANATLHLFTDVLPQLFASFGEMLYDGLTTGFAAGFDKAWSKAVADIKASMRREEGDIERALRQGIQAEERNLNAQRDKFLEEKKAALNLPAQGESIMGGGKHDNAAVERGSVEAYKIINASPQSDKVYRVQSDQLAVLRKIEEELRKKRQGEPGANVKRAKV